jgi:hypothetical protein
MRAVIFAALIGLTVAACTLTAPVTCSADTLVAPPRLTCDQAVNAARPQLATLTDVAAVEFSYQTCRDNERCAFPDDAAGNVVATLADGRRFAVFVSIDDAGRILAEQPRLLTPEPQPVPLPGG